MSASLHSDLPRAAGAFLSSLESEHLGVLILAMGSLGLFDNMHGR